MKPNYNNPKPGFSLMEVLVSLLILLIGVTSVIVLFPIAVARVRQSVLDTRCTFLGRNIEAIVELNQTLTDEPLHVDPSPGLLASDPGDDNYLVDPFYEDAGIDRRSTWQVPNRYYDSYYLNLVDPTHTNGNVPLTQPTDIVDTDPAITAPPGFTTLLHPSSDYGIPILIDPLLVEQKITENVGSGVALNGTGWDPNRQWAITFDTTAFPFLDTQGDWATGAIHPLRVVTTWQAASIANEAARRSYLRRWFTSPGDILYREEMPGIPRAFADADLDDPAITAGGSTADAPALPLASAQVTAERSYPYSWAVLYTKDVNPATDPSQYRPDVGDAENDKVRYLCFYRRNLAKPVEVAVGAFFNGDTRVTLYYKSGAKPHLRRGGWLLEATIKGNSWVAGTNDYTIASNYLTDTANLMFRRITFHRIASYESILVNGVEALSVTLDTEPTGYIENPVPRAAGAFPDLPPGTGGVPQYSTVIIFDGLQEVFGKTTY